MAHQPRDVMAGLEAWRGNGHMGAMCSTGACPVLDETECRKSRKIRKNRKKLGHLWRIHDITPLLVLSVFIRVLDVSRAKTVGSMCSGVE